MAKINNNSKDKGKILASALIDVSKAPPTIPAEKTKAEINNYSYIPFGSNNLFPNELAVICRRSPIHRGIIKNKLNYIIGEGLQYDETNLQLATNIARINSSESLLQVLEKAILDYLYIGNVFIEIATNENRDFISLYHKDGSKVRISKDGKRAILHPDWNYYESKKALATTLPLYPMFEESNGHYRSIIHIKEYEMEYEYYGMPEYISALEAIGISYKTNKWNLSRLENSFQFSGLLEIVGSFDGEGKAEEILEKAKKTYTGEGNNSKLFTIVKNAGVESSKFIPFTQQSEGEWMDLHNQSNQDIIAAHGWFSSLCGFETAGKLGSNQEMRMAYDIIHSSYLPRKRNLFLNVIKEIFKKSKINAESLEFINKTPPSVIEEVDVNVTLTQNEKREMLGYAPVQDEVKQGLNGAQVTSMVEVIRAYKLGEIDKGAAIQILKIAFGISEEEIQKFFQVI